MNVSIKFNVPNLNYKFFLIVSISLIVFGYGFGFYGFPKLLRKAIKSQVHVAKGSKIRPLYTDTPFYIDFRIYLFNVTNKEEVIAGRKPRLQEIGPYFFEEWKKKFDLVDDEEEDTLTYHYSNTYIFRKDLSAPGLTGDEFIVMPHPMLTGMYLSTNVERKPFLSQIDDAVKAMFHDPPDAFFMGKAMDILFNGVQFGCTGDKLAKALCINFDAEIPFTRIDESLMKYSLFGGANGSNLGEIKVGRGKKNNLDLGRVIEVNGDTESNTWSEDECNKFEGTDTTIFPALLPKGTPIAGYDPLVCRPLTLKYVKDSKFMGMPASIYTMELSDEFNSKPCFCREDGTCPPKGTVDLYRCATVPILGSLPHFYGSEELLQNVESGLNPNKKEHGIEIFVNMLTGVAFSAAKRLQFNMEMKPIPEIEIMKTMPDMPFPLFWLEESVVITKKDATLMKYTLFLTIKIIKYLKWICVIVGSIGSVFSLIMMMMVTISKPTVINTKPFLQ